VQLEHDRITQPVSITCPVIESDPLIVLCFAVGTDWPISHLRHEVQIAMGERAKVGHRVNRRKEPHMTISEILPPVSLTIIVLEV
jgi:hypothetical protein